MKLYDFVAIILIPVILFHFAIDYLSDENITKDETKIGFLQLLHYIFISIVFYTPFLSFLLIKDLKYTILSIIILMVIQSGFLINRDRCWYTQMVNKMTNTSIHRKWVSDIPSFIKYYIRGSEWANGELHPEFKYTYEMPVINMCYILILMKFIKF